jgi:hypothetical protein
LQSVVTGNSALTYSLLAACWCRLSKEHSRDLQSVVVGNGSSNKAASAAASGEDASRLVASQPTAIPAALSTEAAAAAAVGSGAGLTRRRGWFSRGRAGKGGAAADGKLGDESQDEEEKPKEQPVKVCGLVLGFWLVLFVGDTQLQGWVGGS